MLVEPVRFQLQVAASTNSHRRLLTAQVSRSLTQSIADVYARLSDGNEGLQLDLLIACFVLDGYQSKQTINLSID